MKTILKHSPPQRWRMWTIHLLRNRTFLFVANRIEVQSIALAGRNQNRYDVEYPSTVNLSTGTTE